MLSKKTIKIISIIALAIMLVMTVSSVVFAGGPKYMPIEGEDPGGISGKIQKAGGGIWTIFTAVGTSVAVIVLVWLGIKYIMASPDGKAEIKKQAFGYILGAVLIFGASTIVGWVVDASSSLIK